MKQALKGISALLCLILVLTLVTGCKGNSAPSPNEIANEIVKQNNLENLNTLSGEKLVSYFGFSASDINRFSVKISSEPDLSDTVAVFETKSEESKALVITGISTYTDKLSVSMKSLETERNKISTRLLMELDNTVILVICGNTALTKESLTEMGAKAVY